MQYRLASHQDVAALTQQLDAAERIAVDTEFHLERRYLPRLFLVQVHVEGGETWLLDPLVEGLLPAVADALCSCTWILHAGLHDLRLLHRALGKLPARVLDTQLAGGLIQPRWPRSLAGLLNEQLDLQLAKAATLSDWSKRPLAPQQLEYAAADVHRLLELWDVLARQVEGRERTGMLEAACRELRHDGETLPPVEESWRNIRGTHVLTPREACVLQELCAWREQEARERDSPPRSVVSDGVLLDLARKRPLSTRVLASNRRFPKAVLKRHGQTLIDGIARAWQRPEWAWPVPVQRYHPSTRRRLLLDLFAETDGRDQDYGPRLGLPETLRDRIAVAWPESRTDVADVLGWRDPLLGERLWGLCSGVLHLSVIGVDTAATESGMP